MGTSKKEKFEASQTKLADFARALAHPARIAIIQKLAESKTCICGEIVEVLPLAQSTVSQHLNDLKEVGLVRGEVDGPRSCYCIDPERFAEMAGLMKEFIDAIARAVPSKKCC